MQQYTIPEGISVGANALVSKLAFDKTVKVRIEEVKDLKEGSYWGRYQDALITIYSKDLKIVYKEGAEVYVTIPEGDFSNKKFIDTSVSFGNGEELPETDLNQLKNVLIPVSPDFILQKDEIKLIAGGEKEKPSEQEVQIPDQGEGPLLTSEQQSNFEWYANNYSIIEIQADFKTTFYHPENFSKSNYGLKFNFIKQGENEEPYLYIIDSGDFNGNLNYFTNYSTQKFILNLEKGTIKNLQQLKAFSDYGSWDYKEVGTPLKAPNIFVKNIIIRFLEKRDLSKSPYYLNIEAPQGHIFSDTPEQITLKGTFYENGTIVKPDEYFWFRRSSLPITPGDSNYNKEAGYNWALIDSEKTEFLSLTKNEYIPYEQEYKLIVKYKDQLFSAKTAVKNKQSLYNIIIEQNGTELKLYNQNIDGTTKSLYGDWFIKVNDDTGKKYVQINLEQDKKDIISFEKYLNYSLPEIQCLVYEKNSTLDGYTYTYLTTKNKKISFNLNEGVGSDQYYVQFVGESFLYKYDANGYSSLLDSSKMNTIEILLYNSKNPNENISPNSSDLKYYINDYDLETSIKDIENNTLLNNISLNNGIISFKIDKIFNINKTKCTIRIEYSDNNGNTYKFDKDLIFLKDGDQGTNGTVYSVIITPDNNKKLISCPQDNPNDPQKKIFDTITLSATVMKGQEEFNGTMPNNKIEYDWSVPIEDKNNPEECLSLSAKNENKIVVTCKSEPDPQKLNLYYVKLKTTITEDSKTSIIYNLYPIDVLKSQNEDLSELDLQIPNLIQYNSAGERPKYDTSALIFRIGKKDYSKDPAKIVLYNNLKRLVDIKKIEQKIIKNGQETTETIGLKLDPVGKFLADTLEIGLIKCIINDNSYILHPIIPYLNTFGNETINGWDGTKFDFIGPEGEEHTILAPQIGAGVKNSSTNTFTGVIMGKDSGQNNKVGLYGYENGIATFGFKDNGSAFIGSSSQGQILINSDGKNKAIIKSATWNTKEDGAGMYLNLTDGILKMKGTKALEGNKTGFIDLNAVASSYPLKIGVGNDPTFKVDWDGKLYAKAGEIAGWKINGDRLENSGNISIFLDGSASGTNNVLQVGSGTTSFSVDGNGKLSATGVKISGDITLSKDSKITWGNIKDPPTIPEIPDLSSYITSSKLATEMAEKGIVFNGIDSPTQMTETAIYSPSIYAGAIYATAEDTTTYSKMTSTGFEICVSDAIKPKFGFKLEDVEDSTSGVMREYKAPILILGSGKEGDQFEEYSSSVGIIAKFANMMWIGNQDYTKGFQVPLSGNSTKIIAKGVTFPSSSGEVVAVWG